MLITPQGIVSAQPRVAQDLLKSAWLWLGITRPLGQKAVAISLSRGRQWGFAPRIGIVYSPDFLKNFVVRAGFGIYYDRGEFFSELSPPAGGGISGPFGVTVDEPFVVDRK